MSSADVIDALFNRTVDIVQSLPKAGPIQTSYEEKLSLYSLYKQATEGNVNSKRPGMLDMLGRAKWDAWSQRHGMGSLEAKQLYVESMMRTLRKFGDRREARELIDELESFSGQVAERVMRGALDTESESEGDSASAPSSSRGHRQPLPGTSSTSRHRNRPLPSLQSSRQASAGSLTPQMGRSSRAGGPGMESIASRSESESESDDEVGEDDDARRSHQLRPSTTSRGHYAQQGPPPRYGPRGPPSVQASLAGGAGASLYSAIAPPSRGGAPQQRRPPSVAGGASTTGGGPPVEHHYYHRASEAGGGGAVSGRAPSSHGGGGGGRPAPPSRQDEALQSIQASLAALHERMNRVEAGSANGRDGNGNSRRRGGTFLLSGAYQAVWNAFHDVANLLGLSTSSGTAGSAEPSFGVTRTNNNHNSGGPSRLRTTLNVVLALINLCLRLTLDLTSLGILLTVLLFLVKRVTGRGDPLVLMRLVRRVLGRTRVERTGAALVAGAVSASGRNVSVDAGRSGGGGGDGQ